MAVAPPLTLPHTSLRPFVSSAEPVPETFVLIVRQHGVLGAHLLAETWRRAKVPASVIDAAIVGAIPSLRATTLHDIARARQDPTPLPPEISGGPLDDLRIEPPILPDDHTALGHAELAEWERSANDAQGFARYLDSAHTTYRLRGLSAVEDAVVQFAAHHVDELIFCGETASDAVADLPLLLASGEPDVMAERQRQVIRRLLAPRPGERFIGMQPAVRSALALAVLADDRLAGDREAGGSAATIAELVATAVPIAAMMESYGTVAVVGTPGPARTPRTMSADPAVEDAQPASSQADATEEQDEEVDEGYTM